MRQQIARRPDAPVIRIPVLRMSAVESAFSLADITDTDRFRKLGASLAANPEGELARTLVSARVVVGPDGMKRAELVTVWGRRSRPIDPDAVCSGRPPDPARRDGARVAGGSGRPESPATMEA